MAASMRWRSPFVEHGVVAGAGDHDFDVAGQGWVVFAVEPGESGTDQSGGSNGIGVVDEHAAAQGEQVHLTVGAD
jgi:hypothetical protein